MFTRLMKVSKYVTTILLKVRIYGTQLFPDFSMFLLIAHGIHLRVSTLEGQQRLKTSKLRNFQTKKCLSYTKTKFAGQKLFPVFVQECFSNINLRHILDYEFISALHGLKKSNTALCPSKLLF